MKALIKHCPRLLIGTLIFHLLFFIPCYVRAASYMTPINNWGGARAWLTINNPDIPNNPISESVDKLGQDNVTAEVEFVDEIWPDPGNGNGDESSEGGDGDGPPEGPIASVELRSQVSTGGQPGASYGEWHGYNSSDNYGTVYTGGFTRGQFYFETADGRPGALEFVYRIHFTAVPGTLAEFSFWGLSYMGPGEIDGSTWPIAEENWEHLNKTYYKYYVNDDGIMTLEHDGVTYVDDPWNPYLMGPQEIEDTFSIRTDFNGNMIQSGTYVPLSFCLHTTTEDASIDWENTVSIDAINAYDQAGNLLPIEEYSFINLNDPNDPFNHEFEPGQPVPAPPAILLLASGALVLAMKRKN